MTTGITNILQLISAQYDIPYDDLLLLIHENKNKIVKKNKPSATTYEYITIDGIDYIYEENTNTVYTYNKENPKETMKEFGYLCPDTCDIISLC
jgi:hypothetical protein